MNQLPLTHAVEAVTIWFESLVIAPIPGSPAVVLLRKAN